MNICKIKTNLKRIGTALLTLACLSTVCAETTKDRNKRLEGYVKKSSNGDVFIPLELQKNTEETNAIMNALDYHLTVMMHLNSDFVLSDLAPFAKKIDDEGIIAKFTLTTEYLKKYIKTRSDLTKKFDTGQMRRTLDKGCPVLICIKNTAPADIKIIKARNEKRTELSDKTEIQSLQNFYKTELGKGAGYGVTLLLGYNAETKEFLILNSQLFSSERNESFWISEREFKYYFDQMLILTLPQI